MKRDNCLHAPLLSQIFSEHVGPEHVVSESLSVAICVSQSLRQKADSSHERKKKTKKNNNLSGLGGNTQLTEFLLECLSKKRKK